MTSPRRTLVLVALAPAIAFVGAARVRADDAPAAKVAPQSRKSFDVFLVLPGQNEPAKVGTAVEHEESRGDNVAHVTLTRMEIGRGPARQEIVQKSEFLEAKDGRLLEFSVRQTINGMGKLIRGRLSQNKVELTVGEGEDARKRTIDRPKNTITPREMEKKMVAAGIAVGRKYKFSVYPLPDEPENAHDIAVEIEAAQTVEFDGRRLDAFRAKVTIDLFGTPMNVVQVLDAKAETYRVEMETGGVKFLMIRTK
jgi:hypothetical protein